MRGDESALGRHTDPKFITRIGTLAVGLNEAERSHNMRNHFVAIRNSDAQLTGNFSQCSCTGCSPRGSGLTNSGVALAFRAELDLGDLGGRS